MTELDKIIDNVVTLRASLNLDVGALALAEKRLLRAHVEHCILDLQHLLSHLVAVSDAMLDSAGRQGAVTAEDLPYRFE